MAKTVYFCHINIFFSQILQQIQSIHICGKNISVKKSKKYTITVTLNKKVKGKFVYVSFNGKVYKAKTNAQGIAKITIKKSVLKKLAGKKVKYQVISGNSLKNKTVKIKK